MTMAAPHDRRKTGRAKGTLSGRFREFWCVSRVSGADRWPIDGASGDGPSATAGSSFPPGRWPLLGKLAGPVVPVVRPVTLLLSVVPAVVEATEQTALNSRGDRDIS